MSVYSWKFAVRVMHWNALEKSPLSESTTRESRPPGSEEGEGNQMEKMDLVSKGFCSFQELCGVLLTSSSWSCLHMQTTKCSWPTNFYWPCLLHTGGTRKKLLNTLPFSVGYSIEGLFWKKKTHTDMGTTGYPQITENTGLNRHTLYYTRQEMGDDLAISLVFHTVPW